MKLMNVLPGCLAVISIGLLLVDSVSTSVSVTLAALALTSFALGTAREH